MEKISTSNDSLKSQFEQLGSIRDKYGIENSNSFDYIFGSDPSFVFNILRRDIEIIQSKSQSSVEDVKRWNSLQEEWVKKIEKSTKEDYEEIKDVYIDHANVIEQHALKQVNIVSGRTEEILILLSLMRFPRQLPRNFLCPCYWENKLYL